MHKTITILFLFISLQLFSQSAEQIIQRHFEATGGVENWNQLNSILIEGKVSIDISEVVDIKIEHKRPYFKRVSYILNGKEQLSEGYDGQQAYTHNELDGKFKKLKDYQADAFETDILNFHKKGFKAELVGKENIKGAETYKIKLIKNTIIDFYWFDAKSYQLVKEENQQETIHYSDFKKAKGLTFAYRMEATPKGGKEYVVVFDKIIPNAAIEDNRFKFE